MSTRSDFTKAVVSVFGLASLLSVAPANAQMMHPKPRPPQQQMERAQERHERWDDRRDYQRIVDISRDWNEARRRHDKVAEQSVDQRLRQWLRDELRESKREQEEARQDAATARPGHERRKEMRDAREKSRDFHKTRAIAQKLRLLQKKFRRNTAGPNDYREKRRLLNELVSMAREELKDDRRDHRRDRRDDRRHDRRGY